MELLIPAPRTRALTEPIAELQVATDHVTRFLGVLRFQQLRRDQFPAAWCGCATLQALPRAFAAGTVGVAARRITPNLARLNCG